jgi:hypothetical protein
MSMRGWAAQYQKAFGFSRSLPLAKLLSYPAMPDSTEFSEKNVGTAHRF